MFARIGAKLACFLLKKGNLSIEDANKCTGAILNNLNALPIHDIISVDSQSQLLVGGKLLSFDDAKKLRIGAVLALENQTLKFVREQVAFAAVTTGVHKAETPAQMFFARAALWYHQQLGETLEVLAQRTESPVEEN